MSIYNVFFIKKKMENNKKLSLTFKTESSPLSVFNLIEKTPQHIVDLLLSSTKNNIDQAIERLKKFTTYNINNLNSSVLKKIEIIYSMLKQNRWEIR